MHSQQEIITFNTEVLQYELCKYFVILEYIIQ